MALTVHPPLPKTVSLLHRVALNASAFPDETIRAIMSFFGLLFIIVLTARAKKSVENGGEKKWLLINAALLFVGIVSFGVQIFALQFVL